MQLSSLPFARWAAVGLTQCRSVLPPWLARVSRPQAFAGTPAGLALCAVLVGAVTVLLLTDVGPQRSPHAGALLVLPVLAAAWTLGSRLFVLVVAFAVATQFLAVVTGHVPVAESAARLVAVGAAALAGRTVAINLFELRRARQGEVGALRLAIAAAVDIGSTQDVTDVVRRVLRRAVEAVPAARGSISRLEGEYLVLEADYADGDPGVLPGTRFRLASSQLAVDAVRTGRPRQGSADAAAPSPEAADWMRRNGQRYVITCPLMVEWEVVGLLGLSRGDRPFTDEDLHKLGALATLAARLLRNARQLAQVRQAGQAKSALMDVAAHELRTPLTVIKAYLSLLEDGTYPVPAKTREEVVETLVGKAQELDSLVDALLTSVRLESGDVPRRPVELDLGEAAAHAVGRITARARLEGARIELRVAGTGLVSRVDPDHVARILDNLLNNALTYSGHSALVFVAVRGGDTIEISVRDHGPGIPMEDQERVFQRFERVGGTSSGVGLGLWISRELARMNGGTLGLQSRGLGTGSEFVLRLPALAPAGLRVPAASGP